MAQNPPFINDPAAAVTRTLSRFGLPGPASIPNTRTRTSHALTIRAYNGRVIGAIHSFSVRQTRTTEDEFEINRDQHGVPVDIVPQLLTARTMSIGRYDLYSRIMEQVFGDTELILLTDQHRPFRIRETWREPTGILGGSRRVYEYIGCYFQELGRTLTTTDDRISKAEATLVWRDRVKVI